MNPRPHRRSAPAMALALVAVAMPAIAQDDGTGLARIKEQELELVREKISGLKKSMDRRADDRDRITGELQTAEVLIAEKRTHLKEIERQKRFSEKKKAELDRKLGAERAALERETGLLAAQVRAAYMSGSRERVKLLLNQQDPATLGRLTTYYRYLSQYRGENIDAVNGHIDELTVLQEAAGREENRLAGLARAQFAELAELNDVQGQRQQLIVTLNAKIEEEGSEIERLAAEEQDLARLIAELRTILSDYPINSEEPFSELKGRLTWPVAGRLINDFGQPRASGGMRWNGVVLAAPLGREVRAIYHGRVVFADWLAGMGLLVIVDHGEGFLSLYGYNETTLKTAGDWVAPGDVIATVGESGGQLQPALYFEIRRDMRPVNPRAWISRSPKSG